MERDIWDVNWDAESPCPIQIQIFGRSTSLTVDQAQSLAKDASRLANKEGYVVIQDGEAIPAYNVNRFGGPACVLSPRGAEELAQALWEATEAVLEATEEEVG